MIYAYTNETLKAIVTGLNPTPEDTILATGGSGDQAFALLEFAGKVKVVDIVPEQVDYIQRRKKALKIGDYDSFFKAHNGPYHWAHWSNEKRTREYFQEEHDRLEKIRGNLQNLEIAEPANIVEIAQKEQGHSKIYLSNILGYREIIYLTEIRDVLEKIAQNLPINGLIYVTNGGGFSGRFLPPTLKIDEDLSSKTKEIWRWLPAVYRKIQPE